MDKFLFLDVDEVLQSARTRSAYSHTKEGNLHNILDPVAVDFIHGQYLQGVKIVLSSAWRIRKLDLLTTLVPFEIYSVTKSLGSARGVEVETWLRDNATNDYRYAIIDDSQDFLNYQRNHLVLIDGIEGMLYKDFVKICGLLETQLYKA